MNIKTTFLVGILTSLLIGSFSFAYAENGLTVAAASPHKGGMPPPRGMLYRVRHQGNTAYLFGTIHVGKPAFFPLGAEVTRALARASKLVVELDIRNGEPFQQALKKHGLYAPGDTIDQHLSAAGMAQLRRTLERFHIPFDSIARMKPWLVTNFLIGVDLDRNGYQRSHGVESFLLSFAADHTKTVHELESAEYQLALFDGMTAAEQERYLLENLAQLDDGNALKKAQALIDAWASANGNAVEEMLREAASDKTLSSEFTQRILLDKRNPEMATKIESFLKNDETTFVGVGLLHLIGETGLPKLLRQRGYEVEKLY